jgi:hypothetical protein
LLAAGSPSAAAHHSLRHLPDRVINGGGNQ